MKNQQNGTFTMFPTFWGSNPTAQKKGANVLEETAISKAWIF